MSNITFIVLQVSLICDCYKKAVDVNTTDLLINITFIIQITEPVFDSNTSITFIKLTDNFLW